MNKKVLIGALLVIVILGAAAWLLSWYGSTLLGTNTAVSTKPGVTFYQQLATNNTSFTQGVTLFNAGNYAEAANQFTQALPNAQNAGDANLINLYLASSLQNQGQYEQAVSIFKSIASSSNSSLTRAYAIQKLGQMFYSFKDPRITKAVFTGDPYQGMVVQNDVSASYRNLFAYAAGIYPLATSEYRVAQWYASDYASLGKGSSSTNAQATDMSAVTAALEAGDADLPRLLANARSAPQDYVAALNVRASVVATLFIAGNTSYNPDATYKQLLSVYATYGVPDGYARIAYAGFIVSDAGMKRASDVVAVLTPLYQGSLTTHGVGLGSYLKNGESSSSTRALYVQIAQNDPRFETLLISLGWSSSDFK